MKINTAPSIAPNILFIGTEADKPYLGTFKQCLRGAGSVKTLFKPVQYTAQVEGFCKQAGTRYVITTSQALLESLIPSKKKPTINNYAGSVIERNGVSYLFLSPLEHLITTNTGVFLASRYCSKFTQPHLWHKLPDFSWTLLSAENVDSIFSRLQSASIIGMDIETKLEPVLRIDTIAFTGLLPDMTTMTVVIEIKDMWSLTQMRRFCAELQPPKVLQNGLYDIAYLTSWGCPVYNYLFDTIAFMHCTYSELPKTLDALAVFWLRDAQYWKDLAATGDRYEYFKYNALDSWYTVLIAAVWLLDAPQYARTNFVMEMPLVFPCHLASMTGIQRDMEALERANVEHNTKGMELHRRLETMTVQGINPNSPVQVKALLKALGCSDLQSTDEKSLKKAALRHPINSVICNLILDIRGERKLLSTYITPGKEYKGTILYAIYPWGTDTGRCASKEHFFWCGLQVQNIPRGKDVKQTLVAYDGFRIAECDLEQAESRDTAYISGDEALIHAVESDRDFHSLNCSAFFGVPYEQIYCDVTYYDAATGKTIEAGVLDKKLRDLAKRVNHGANYNMGEGVLVDTMGEDKIWEAKRVLGLPKSWFAKQVAKYLLATFHRTYPKIRSVYYQHVIDSVTATHVLVGATGWTRYCFGNPAKNKRDLNAYVAHCPQSLNAMKLNKAFLRVFYEVALQEPEDFRLCAQIHDSILFQFKEGRTDLAAKVQELMHVTIDIVSCTGVKYTYTVPAALKAGKDGQGAQYWSDTE